MKISRGRKLLFTVILFVLAIVVVGLASGTHRAGVLFLAWIPLLTVAWVLTRPEPGLAWPGAPQHRVATDEQGSTDTPPPDSTPATAEENSDPES